jgi:hypothetical protein
MKQIVVVFHLRAGSKPETASLAGTDPPFDPAEAGFTRVAAYVTQREAIFELEAKSRCGRRTSSSMTSCGRRFAQG